VRKKFQITKIILVFWFVFGLRSTFTIDLPFDKHSSLNFSKVFSKPIYSKYLNGINSNFILKIQIVSIILDLYKIKANLLLK
jgi:hypothetical protein